MAKDSSRQKFYCFVDESGQDTKGKIFLVAIVVKEQEGLEVLKEKLLKIEAKTKKNLIKWSSSSKEVREKYLKEVTALKEISGAIFYSIYHDTKEYVPLVAITLAKAIHCKNNTMGLNRIIIDGLNDKERDRIRLELKKLGIRYDKIRGMKDEQDAVLRLADTIAGLFRSFKEGEDLFASFAKNLIKEKIVTEI